MPEVDPASPVPPSGKTTQSGSTDEAFSPKFTIVTVTYNAGHTLERTLRSVAGQSYPNVEHIIVDGVSSDATLSLVQEYVEDNSICAHPHEICLIREPDNGLYDAMNKAIDNAVGDYLVFLNAGDKLHSADTLESVVRSAAPLCGNAPDQWPAVLYGETDIVDNEGHFLRHRRLQSPEKLHWRSFLDGMMVCHQSFYVRTDLARKQHYNLRYRFSADYDWAVRIMKDADTQGLVLHNTGIVLTDYLSEGMTTSNHRRSLLERLRIMCRHYGYLTALRQHMWFVLRLFLRP